MTRRRAKQTIAVDGELTIFTAAAIREQLLAAFAGADEVEVDLAGVSEMDSAGLQLMVAARREAAMQDKPLRFVNRSSAVADVLGLCDLAAHFGDAVPAH